MCDCGAAGLQGSGISGIEENGDVRYQGCVNSVIKRVEAMCLVLCHERFVAFMDVENRWEYINPEESS